MSINTGIIHTLYKDNKNLVQTHMKSVQHSVVAMAKSTAGKVVFVQSVTLILKVKTLHCHKTSDCSGLPTHSSLCSVMLDLDLNIEIFKLFSHFIIIQRSNLTKMTA